ncbi:MAG: UbiA family prenyltransferase [Chitinophagaceae bacterium]
MYHWQKWAYYGQWTIAAGAVAQCFETAVRLGLRQINPWFYVLIGTCTLLQYMIHFRFFVNRTTGNQRQLFFRDHKSFLWAQFIIGAILFTISFFIAGFILIAPLGIIGLFAGAYSFFLLRPRHNGIFKYNGLFKILTLTVSWAGVTGVLPVVAAGQNLSTPSFLFHFSMRWLMMLAICLPFDVRDIDRDRQNGTVTIPAIIGKKNAFAVCYVSIVLNMLLVALSVGWGWNNWSIAFTNGLANIVMIGSIWYSSRHLDQEFSWFLLDGNFVIHALMVSAILLV